MGALVSSTTTVHPFDYEPNNWSRFLCCSPTISKSKSVAVQTHAYGLMFEKVDHVKYFEKKSSNNEGFVQFSYLML